MPLQESNKRKGLEPETISDISAATPADIKALTFAKKSKIAGKEIRDTKVAVVVALQNGYNEYINVIYNVGFKSEKF